MEINEQLEMIRKYGNKNSCYTPFVGGVLYPIGSEEFIRTGFMEICPTLAARDYKEPKCVIVESNNE